MWIKKLKIKNFRLFKNKDSFELNDINIPTGSKGSGLTVFIGENGSGKTSILDAISLPFLSYKADSITIDDFNDPTHGILIQAFSDHNFTVSSTMPKGEFKSCGFQFDANIRARGNKAYLSSIVVSDQKFIKPEGQDKPKDYSPDLRINVNNPFKGKRFDENDILYLDKNRTYQIRSGTYNNTRFDRLMEDFNYQYIAAKESIPNHDEYLNENIKQKIDHEYLADAVRDFKEISGIDLSLELIENWKPFKNSFFAERKENNIQINLNNQGSGYEMIFSLIYSFYMARQSGKELIALIDEPELHLHPRLQKKFIDFLFEASMNTQIIITSHSPLFVKQLLTNSEVEIIMLKKDDLTIKKIRSDSMSLPYISANEVNSIAFEMASAELHNELYGHLQETCEMDNTKDFDNWLNQEHNIKKEKKWTELRGKRKKRPYDCTLQTFIRHSIHHPENDENPGFSEDELQESCNKMIGILKNQTS